MKHTSGPWQVGDNDGHNANTILQRIDGCEPLAIANVYNVPMGMTVDEVRSLKHPRYAEGLANARLIAAAPELLEIVKRYYNREDYTFYEKQENWFHARALLQRIEEGT